VPVAELPFGRRHFSFRQASALCRSPGDRRPALRRCSSGARDGFEGSDSFEGIHMDDLVRSTIAFVQNHQAWGVPIVFVLAFCESFAFVSLLVPATGILLGVGGLIAAAELGFWPMWSAAALGAIVGDWLAYWLAFHFKDRVLQTWPLAGKTDLVARSVAFFKKWGMLAVFVGRFFGPLRAVVPLIAGLNAMPWLNFQIANVASAALWAAGILLPGFIGVRWLME
jgi:membrane protein DedA with SNARE-associated domain